MSGRGTASVADTAGDDAPQIQPAREVQKNHRVGRREPEIQRATVISIQHPGFTADDPAHGRFPLVPGGLPPTSAPEQSIQVYDFQAKRLAEPL